MNTGALYPSGESDYVLFGTVSNLSQRVNQVTNNNIDVFDYKYLTVVVYNGGYIAYTGMISTKILKALQSDVAWTSVNDRRLAIVSTGNYAGNFDCTISIDNVYSGHNYHLNGHTLELDCGGNTSVTSSYKAYIYVNN